VAGREGRKRRDQFTRFYAQFLSPGDLGDQPAPRTNAEELNPHSLMDTPETTLENPRAAPRGLEAGETTGTRSVRISRTLDQVYSLRDTWTRFQSHPNSDIDYYLTVAQCRPEILRPHVLAVTSKGTPETILVGRVENTRLELKVGYKTLPGPRVRCLTLIQAGLLGNASNENCSELVGSIWKSLSEGEADLACFHHLKVDSPLYRTALDVPGILSRDWFPVTNQHWRIRVPSSFEELCQGLSPNTRHNLRRYPARLRKAFGKDLVVRSFKDTTHREQLFTDTEAVAAKSYHRGLGVGFINNPETSRLISLALDRGWFRAYILYLRGTPCAFWNGLRYGNTFFTGTTAYDFTYHQFRPGTFLFQTMLEDLCHEGGIEAVDFGLGDAQYKRDWADDNWQESSVYMFAPTLRGLPLSALRASLMLPDRLARRVLIQTGLLANAKRIWRDRLRKTAVQSAVRDETT